MCIDKTGTLTQNKMIVGQVWYDGLKRKAANIQKYGQNFEYEYDVNDPTFRDLHDCAILNSEAKFNIPGRDKSDINWLL